MFEKFNEAARRALFFSRYEAGRLAQSRIDTEHLLLGILREADPATTELWSAFSFDPHEVRGRYPSVVVKVTESAALPLSEEMTRILRYAVEEAELRDDRYVTPSHLVLAILREPQCAAAQLLAPYGVAYELVREVVRVFKEHAAVEQHAPLVLRESHDELLARLGEPMRTTRQSVALAIMDALAASGIGRVRFASMEEFQRELHAAFSARWPP
jgi:ATP-dependent Clp protease ATP-binding subunit ClpA